MNDKALVRTGRFMGGLTEDIKRKLPFYKSDFTDGMHSSVVGTTLFLFFAALANAIAFGALTSVLTNNEIGIIEMLVVSSVGGIAFALFAGQPLGILGGTGPIVIFTGMLYTVCQQLEVDFLTVYAWVGIWSGIMLLIAAFTDASVLIKYFTQFTDEIFAALISVIFIVEAVKNVVGTFGESDPSNLSPAFLTVILALGTFILSIGLRNITKTSYLRNGTRVLISDFGPALAIIIMTILALSFPQVSTNTPKVPDTIQTTSGRPWLIDIFSAPQWVIWGSIIPAFLATILLFLDQNITARLLNSRKYKLKKGYGYHLDLLLVGLVVLVGSFFGLPWLTAATVHSLNHSKSLSKTKIRELSDGTRKEVITGVRENRVSGLFVHLLMLGSIFLLGYFGNIPLAILYGLFLYMGLASLAGNHFFDRMKLWVTDPKLIPDTPLTRRVPMKSIHKFTFLQLLCFIALWLLKSSVLGILFPLFIAALVPINMLVNKFFSNEQIAALMTEEDEGEEEQYL